VGAPFDRQQQLALRALDFSEFEVRHGQPEVEFVVIVGARHFPGELGLGSAEIVVLHRRHCRG